MRVSCGIADVSYLAEGIFNYVESTTVHDRKNIAQRCTDKYRRNVKADVRRLETCGDMQNITASVG